MLSSRFKLLALPVLAFSVLISSVLPGAVAQVDNPATIDSADWKRNKDKLIVRGILAPKGTVITVTDADSGDFLGTAVANRLNIWRLVTVLQSNVPCSVQAEANGSTDLLAVQNAPEDCGPNTGPPTDPVDNPATIDSAAWKRNKDKLIVRGILAPKGTEITITDADSGNLLGTAVANRLNIWRLVTVLQSNVPCSVQAEANGSTDLLTVQNAPADCGPVAGPPTDPVDPIVELGKDLFFNETFNGNGRTCGTCHRAENNFTIDTEFIATLPPDDPLFVSENNPELAELEDSTLLRQFGLIRANADGFENPTEKFVMRSASHLFGLASSIQSNTTETPLEMTGWSGDGSPGSGTLREFSTGAVVQHFTKSLDRIEGQDFRLPTEVELDALAAYMLSLGGHASLDLQTLRLTDTAAERGRVLFITEDSENGTKRAAKCNACHTNAGALTVAGINQNFDTGVENAVHAADLTGAPRPRDGGFGTQLDENSGAFGDGTFNPPPLLNAADTAPYFHNNVAATLEDAIAHYESNEFRTSPEGQRLLLADTGGQELTVDVDALAAFLRVINVIENIRTSIDHMSRAKLYVTAAGIQGLLTSSVFDLNDVLKVLTEGNLHEEVVPHIDSAKAFLASAMAEPEANTAARNNFINLAIAATETGRDLTVSVLPATDTVAPVVAIAAPTSTNAVFGLVNIQATATDEVGINNVIFKVDQTVIGQDNSPPFEAVLNTTEFSDGEHLLTVTAIDPSNNSGSATITMVIDNGSVVAPPDTTNPTIAITAPSDGSTVSETVTISADAFDNSGVANVIFRIGSTEIGQDTTPPYQQVWDTTTFSDGSQNITVVALDAANNSASHSISVVVDNASAPPPPPCTVYSCPNPPPPPTEPPPDPIIPDGSSPDGEFEGVVTNVDLQAFTVTIDTGVTVKITSETLFNGVIATNISQLLIGHIAQGEFFQSTGETVWIEADLPPGL
ncbi:Ig-like domain-containing protein [Pseudomonadota bacterium]